MFQARSPLSTKGVCQAHVDLRTCKPVENFYNNLFEPNRGYAWKQYLNRRKKMLSGTFLNKYACQAARVISSPYFFLPDCPSPFHPPPSICYLMVSFYDPAICTPITPSALTPPASLLHRGTESFLPIARGWQHPGLWLACWPLRIN